MGLFPSSQCLEVQAEERDLQNAMELNRDPFPPHAITEAADEDRLQQIQRQSLVEAIRAQLPVTPWAKDAEAETCPLCLEEYSPGDSVMRLTCFHAFHKSCLDPWLDKNPTCPSCKLDLCDLR